VNGSSLLLVDDEPLAAEYMSLALLPDYADIRCAANGVEALLAVEAAVPDLVVSDLRMPCMDGLELLTHLKERWPRVPVILVTVEDDVATVVEALRQGAVNYLVKPVSPPVLRTAVRKALCRPVGPPGPTTHLSELVGVSEAMVRIRHLAVLAARSDANVLITGETGTGKELVARAIHRLSKASRGPFVPHNCAVTPPDLFESEFFGHRRGAFTGADRDHAGLLKSADGGVLFLDELECLSPAHQAKLLRVLDDGVVRPVGSSESFAVSIRVLSATNRPPEKMLRDGTLREDLYYRLRGLELALPPLRDRRGDIPILAAHFLSGTGAVLAPAALKALESSSWPGNIRQLQSVLSGALGLAAGGALAPRHLQLNASGLAIRSPGPSSEEGSLKRLERDAIERALQQAGGNRIRAARVLGIHRSTLRRKMEALGLRF